ncbi:Protein CBR-KCNL-3 [Caenorhabditis briggsae]|uniref:Protein CBR-KCNL-3 n=1 Tax=Caenorhabditis briggsae TaxID=6238 RepID=A8XKF6_CAEBR|nr:Protein CBR-KCNL-3 [Caenorhabditis briggsae]CAP33130.2 Protein CBR-KCNL-3 [Caenorhabditis briggsae]
MFAKLIGIEQHKGHGSHSIDLSTMQMEPDLSYSDVITGSTDLEMERPNSRLHCHPEITYKCTVQPYFSLHTHTPTAYNNNTTRHRPSLGTLQTADTLHARRFLSDKRRSYRNRSLGPTIASAPSVEQEDYRTPRPSFDSNGYAGKSFDFSSAHAGLTTSDSNPLVKVSADFLRLNGSRQQFKNLLSARKKLGSLPPAYTRIDFSRESLDSHSARALSNHHGPVITVEDTGSQLRINNIKPSVNQHLLETSCSFEKTMVTQCERNGSVTSHNTSSAFQRNNSRYGVPIDSIAVKQVYRVRSERLINRVRITDRSLYSALFGVILMLIESELTAERVYGVSKDHWISQSLRVGVAFSTIILLFHIVLYHLNDITLELVDCGADDWRVVVTTERVIQFCAEFVCCAICPLPGSGEMKWTFIEPSLHKDGTSEGRTISTRSVEVPVDIILSCLMLCRSYLFARFMVLHSKQFQDASTRTLAALNRIQVNFSFVIKTSLDQQPVLFLTSFTFIFWIIMSWMFVQCERYGFSEKNPQSILYSNSLWFIAITFMLNGYGDIVPQTNAGRFIAIFVGVVGAVISSILIAVISRNILLSQGQRNVNNFMYDSKLSREHKEAAARVLQHTWHIHKCLQGGEGGNRRLRTYQRKFLKAIHRFRAVKSEMREFSENNAQNNPQMTRLVTDMHTSMQRLLNVQEEMRMQIEVLQQSVRNHYHHSTPNVPQLQGLTSSSHPSERHDSRY